MPTATNATSLMISNIDIFGIDLNIIASNKFTTLFIIFSISSIKFLKPFSKFL